MTEYDLTIDTIYYNDMFQAIDKTQNGWERIKQDPGKNGFFASDKPDVKKLLDEITSHMKLLGGHSGYSMAMCLRTMQFIAKDGVEKHRNKYK